MASKSVSYRMGEWILKYRWPLILLNFVVFAFVVMGMANRVKSFVGHLDYMKMVRDNPLKATKDHVKAPPIFNSDYHVFFDSDNEELIAYDNLQKEYAKEDTLIVVFKSKSGNLFTNENLETLRFLTREFWKVPYVYRVDGLVNFNYTTAENDDLLVDDFISTLPMSEEALSQKRALALKDPLIPKFLLSKEADITQISLRVIAPQDFPNAYLDAKEGTRALIEEAMKQNSDLTMRMAGPVLVNTSFVDFAMRDNQVLTPLMFAFIMVVLLVVLRSFWGTVLPVGLILTSVLFVICLFVGVFNLSLTNVSNVVIQIMVAIAVADSVHVLTMFYQKYRQGLSKRDAILYTVEKNMLPCFLTSLTTAIGFYSLLFQSIPPFRDLGLFAGTGTMFAFWASLFTMPAMMAVLPFRKPKEKQVAAVEKPHPVFDKMAVFVVGNQRSIRLFAIISGVALFVASFYINLDSTVMKYFDEKSEFRQATQYIDEHIIGTNPLEFSFDSGKADGIKDPLFLKKIERFQSFIQSNPSFHVTHVGSVVDVVKRMNKTMHGDQDSFYRIPEDEDATATGEGTNAKNLIGQYLLLYSLSLPQGMELTNQINIDYSKTRVTVFMKMLPMKEQIAVADTIQQWLDREMPEVNARGVGISMMFTHLMNVAIPGMIRSLILSLIFITLTLIVTFRSLKYGLLSMIPNLWPIIFIFGVIALIQYEVNLSVVVVGMVTLGIAVDDSIHFLAKYLSALKKGLAPLDAIKDTYHVAGNALIFTSVILVFGFGVLSISDFLINANMGILCSAVLVLALLADLIILPAFLLMVTEKQGVKANASETTSAAA